MPHAEASEPGRTDDPALAAADGDAAVIGAADPPPQLASITARAKAPRFRALSST